jgi:hypothetical protein
MHPVDASRSMSSMLVPMFDDAAEWRVYSTMVRARARDLSRRLEALCRAFGAEELDAESSDPSSVRRALAGSSTGEHSS